MKYPWLYHPQNVHSPKIRNWFSIKNQDEGKAEIFIFDEIGFFGTTANSFVQELKALSGRDLTVRLNTPGGDVFEGLAIFSALKRHDGKVETVVDGLAASAGAVVAMAGSTVTMSEHALMMIHDAWGMMLGNAEEMREFANVLDKISGQVANIFADKSSMKLEKVRALMAAETWFTAEEAEDAGLIDGRADAADSENAIDASRLQGRYRNIPETLPKKEKPKPAPSEEDSLRIRTQMQRRLDLVSRNELTTV